MKIIIQSKGDSFKKTFTNIIGLRPIIETNWIKNIEYKNLIGFEFVSETAANGYRVFLNQIQSIEIIP